MDNRFSMSKTASKIYGTSRRAAFLSALLVCFLFAGCAGHKKMNDLGLPPNASAAEIGGYDREQFNNALAAALGELKKRHAFTETETLHVSPPADWRSLAAFYDAALEPDGYRRTTAEPISNTDSQTLTWRNGEDSGGEYASVVIVNTTDAQAGGGRRQYIVVCR